MRGNEGEREKKGWYIDRDVEREWGLRKGGERLLGWEDGEEKQRDIPGRQYRSVTSIISIYH